MNPIDVTLISTPLVRFGFNFSGIYPMPHLGLGYLGAVLSKAGCRLAYLDSQIPAQNILENPDAIQPSGVYALTAKITNLRPTHQIALAIREKFPSARIILGGPCNVISPEVIFDQFPVFDVLATGEGENIVLPLVHALLSGKRADEMTGIKGLAIRIDGRVEVSPPAEPADLSEDIHPLRSLWDFRIHKMHPPYGVYSPVSLMETARGCNFNCMFCLISKTLRERPIPVVLSEARELVMEKGVNEIHFVDPTFTLNRKRTEDLCEALLTIPRRFHWTCKTRTDCVSPELLRLMARSGCYLIAYGIESGSESMLASMNKQVGAQRTTQALQWTHEAGIRSIGYLLVGTKGETDRTIAETNRYLHRTKCAFVLFGINMPGPRGAPPGPDGKPMEAELVRWYTTGELGPFLEIAPSGFPHKKLNAWMLRSLFAFYLYPPTLFRALGGIRSFSEVAHYARGAYLLAAEFVRYGLRRIGLRRKSRIHFSDGHG